MPYVLFVVTPDQGKDMIPSYIWDRFEQGVTNLSLSSPNSVLLNRGCWQLDLDHDEAAFYTLLSAAKGAEASYRYLSSQDQFAWVFSSGG